jgi:DNA-binding transcriptional LysR family regulator
MSTLDWEQVRVFLAVARERSLAGASARLGLDISTVSRRLDRLEHELGAALFDRSRDGTTPTELGEQMMPHAEEMELAAARFANAGAVVETRVEGVVRMTMPPGIADTFVAPALARLNRKYPDLVIELDASIGYADLTRREADIALRAHRPASGDLVAVKLLEARAAPLTSPAYAKELGRLKRLADARWIVWAKDLSHLPDAQWLKRNGPDVKVVFSTSHFASQLAAAKTGLGVVLAAQPFASADLVEVQHARALDAIWADLPVSALWLVGHKALRNVPRVAAVWSFVLDTIKAASADQ